MVRLLHLSDIHFSKRSNTHYDLDQHVRDELSAELKTQLQHGAFTGCVITGDIAFSGNDIEYDEALKFLSTLSEELGFPLGSIWIVPGNHDYNRGAADDSRILRDLIRDFRKFKEADLNKQIVEYSTSIEHKDKLFNPLTAYNGFAKQFNCDISSEKSFWDAQIQLSENPKVNLYLRGLNSCLISSFEDDDKNDHTKMIMSLRQCQLGPKTDGIKMSLCHHPISWIRNGKELQTQLGNSFHVQLFGHEHEPSVDELNGSVLVHAGAVHPERNEGAAVPTYNILEFSVHQEEKNELVKLNVISRSYDIKAGRYKTIEPKKGFDHRYTFPLPKQGPVKQVDSVVTAPVAASASGPVTAPVAASVAAAHPAPMSELDEQLAIRTLQVHFYSLIFYQQLEILQKLDLVTVADNEILEKKKFSTFFQRAKEKDLLEEMWRMVSLKRGIGINDNPFRQVQL